MAIQILNCVIGLNQTEILKYVLDKYVSPLFGAKIGDPRYDPRVDLNNDGIIDLKDITLFAHDAGLTFKTFGITPLLWYHVAAGVTLGLSLVGVAAWVLLKKR